MPKALRRKPSASMVVAILALVVAASGTAIAAGHLTSGDKLIKKRSLSGDRLRNHTITGKQVNMRRLGKVPSAKNADHATTANSATSLSRLDYESATATLAPANANVTKTVICPARLNAVGGGAKVSNPSTGFIRDTFPVARTGWRGDARSTSGAGTMTVYVICAPAAHTTP